MGRYRFPSGKSRTTLLRELGSRFIHLVILTTNITDLKALERLIGEQIIDRLFEGESTRRP